MNFRGIQCYTICMIRPSGFWRVFVNVPRQPHPLRLLSLSGENTNQGVESSPVEVRRPALKRITFSTMDRAHGPQQGLRPQHPMKSHPCGLHFRLLDLGLTGNSAQYSIIPVKEPQVDLQFSSFWKNYFFLQFKLRATDFVKSKQAHFFLLKNK